jgi:hypothetical protein
MKRARAGNAAERLLFEWTDLSYQQVTGGNAAALLCVPDLRAVRVPGAGRAIWQLEPAVRGDPDRADVPARRAPGVRLMGQDVNILTQIGFVVLVGLAARTRS